MFDFLTNEVFWSGIAALVAAVVGVYGVRKARNRRGKSKKK